MSCEHRKGEVIETRRHAGSIYRRRQCHLCGLRYVTVETIHNGPIPKPPVKSTGPKTAKPHVVREKAQDRRMAAGAAALATVFR